MTDEHRRDFLKALGVGGAVAVGSVTMGDVQKAVEQAGTAEAAAELAPMGQAIAADLGGALDAELIAAQQGALAEATAGLPLAVERGFPEAAPREEFMAVAEAGRPMYEHLRDVGFFESTTEHLPEFHPEYLESAVQTVAGSQALVSSLEEFGLDGHEGVDLLATVVAEAENMAKYHWVGGDIIREKLEFGKHVPPITQSAVGGTLLWLEDLDQHFWEAQTILTDEMLEKAVWHAQSMAAGLHLVSEGTAVIAEESGTLSDSELAATLGTGFAVQAIAQSLLPTDVYWVREEMRADSSWASTLSVPPQGGD